MRTATLDRRLLGVTLALMTFGLLTLYSAGQTDVPTHAAGVWTRQFFWFGIGTIVGWVVFHTSLRLLEWLAPALYAFSIALLELREVEGMDKPIKVAASLLDRLEGLPAPNAE